MNKVEELAANVKSPSKRSSPDGDASNASESEKEEELNLDGPMGDDAQSPGKRSRISGSKKKQIERGYDSDEERKMEEEKKKQAEAFNTLKETFDKFQE